MQNIHKNQKNVILHAPGIYGKVRNITVELD